MFYMENKSIKQIANQLQKPVGTIKSRLFTAREQLKQTLKLIYDEK